MKLRIKIPLIVGLVFVISFISLSFALREIVLNAFTREGERETADCARQIQLNLEREIVA